MNDKLKRMLENKALLLRLLAPLGYYDPEPNESFAEICHQSNLPGLVLNAYEVTPDNAITIIRERSVQFGKQLAKAAVEKTLASL